VWAFRNGKGVTLSTHLDTVPPYIAPKLEGKKLREIVDGTSRTIMAVETNPDKMVVWTQPADLAYDPKQPLEGLGKVRPGGFLALFADGSVHFISDDISPDTLRAMVTYAGREPLPPLPNP